MRLKKKLKISGLIIFTILIVNYFNYFNPEVVNDFVFPSKYKKDISGKNNFVGKFTQTLSGDSIILNTYSGNEIKYEFYNEKLELVDQFIETADYDERYFIWRNIGFGIFSNNGDSFLNYTKSEEVINTFNISNIIQQKIPEAILITLKSSDDVYYSDHTLIFLRGAYRIDEFTANSFFVILGLLGSDTLELEYMEILNPRSSGRYSVQQFTPDGLILKNEILIPIAASSKYSIYTNKTMKSYNVFHDNQIHTEGDTLFIFGSEGEVYYIIENAMDSMYKYIVYGESMQKVGELNSSRRLSFVIQGILREHTNFIETPKYNGIIYAPFNPIEEDGYWKLGIRISENSVDWEVVSTDYMGFTEKKSNLQTIYFTVNPHSITVAYIFTRTSIDTMISITAGSLSQKLLGAPNSSIALIILDIISGVVVLVIFRKKAKSTSFELFPEE